MAITPQKMRIMVSGVSKVDFHAGWSGSLYMLSRSPRSGSRPRTSQTMTSIIFSLLSGTELSITIETSMRLTAIS